MGKTLQERIIDIGEYNPDIMFKDGNFILKITYRDKWVIIKPDNPDKIAFAEDNCKKNMYWYVCTIDNVDILFDLVDETIKANKEIERKKDLYNEKVKELQELFLSDIGFDMLKTLEFTFPKKKGRPASKKNNENTTECDKIENIVPEAEKETLSDIDLAIEKAMEGKK